MCARRGSTEGLLIHPLSPLFFLCMLIPWACVKKKKKTILPQYKNKYEQDIINQKNLHLYKKLLEKNLILNLNK